MWSPMSGDRIVSPFPSSEKGGTSWGIVLPRVCVFASVSQPFLLPTRKNAGPSATSLLVTDGFPETAPRGHGELFPTTYFLRLVGEPKEFGKFENQGGSGS